MHQPIRGLGLDIGKPVFRLVGTDGRGTVVWRKRYRSQLMAFITTWPPAVIGMAACGGEDGTYRPYLIEVMGQERHDHPRQEHPGAGVEQAEEVRHGNTAPRRCEPKARQMWQMTAGGTATQHLQEE